ncbi:hypothetical protein RI367_004760 [Sorochytrium milnesiophthora]
MSSIRRGNSFGAVENGTVAASSLLPGRDGFVSIFAMSQQRASESHDATLLPPRPKSFTRSLSSASTASSSAAGSEPTVTATTTAAAAGYLGPGQANKYGDPRRSRQRVERLEEQARVTRDRIKQGEVIRLQKRSWSTAATASVGSRSAASSRSTSMESATTSGSGGSGGSATQLHEAFSSSTASTASIASVQGEESDRRGESREGNGGGHHVAKKRKGDECGLDTPDASSQNTVVISRSQSLSDAACQTDDSLLRSALLTLTPSLTTSVESAPKEPPATSKPTTDARSTTVATPRKSVADLITSVALQQPSAPVPSTTAPAPSTTAPAPSTTAPVLAPSQQAALAVPVFSLPSYTIAAGADVSVPQAVRQAVMQVPVASLPTYDIVASTPPADNPLMLAAKKASAGKWSCDACMTLNEQTSGRCCACDAAAPGTLVTGNVLQEPVKKVTADPTPLSAASAPVNPFEQLAKKQSVGRPGAQPAAPAPPVVNPFEQLAKKQSAGKWSCDTCMTLNDTSADSCCACTAAKPGAQPSTAPSSAFQPPQPQPPVFSFAPPPPPTSSSGASLSSSFSASSLFAGFKGLNGPVAAFAPPRSTSAPAGATFGAATTATTAASADVGKPVATAPPPAGSNGFTQAFKGLVQQQAAKWTCQVCMVNNAIDAKKCVCCESPR